MDWQQFLSPISKSAIKAYAPSTYTLGGDTDQKTVTDPGGYVLEGVQFGSGGNPWQNPYGGYGEGRSSAGEGMSTFGNNNISYAFDKDGNVVSARVKTGGKTGAMDVPFVLQGDQYVPDFSRAQEVKWDTNEDIRSQNLAAAAAVPAMAGLAVGLNTLLPQFGLPGFQQGASLASSLGIGQPAAHESALSQLSTLGVGGAESGGGALAAADAASINAAGLGSVGGGLATTGPMMGAEAAGTTAGAGGLGSVTAPAVTSGGSVLSSAMKVGETVLSALNTPLGSTLIGGGLKLLGGLLADKNAQDAYNALLSRIDRSQSVGGIDLSALRQTPSGVKPGPVAVPQFNAFGIGR